MRIQAVRIRPLRFAGFAFIACVVSVLVLPPSASGQAPDEKKKPKPEYEFRGIVEIGAQLRHVQGGHTAKFEEVRDVPKGLFVQKLSLDIDSEESPYFIRLRGFELRERDQRFSAEIAKVGKFRFNFLWDQVPHHFGDGQSFLQETSPGVYQVSPTLRAALQALTLPDNVRTPANGPLPTLVRQELLNAPVTEVRLRRDQALIRGSYQFSDNVELYAQFSWTQNRGTRPMSAGTFIRRAVPGNGLPDIGGFWEGVGQEFLEPLDQRTTDFKLGANFGSGRWRAGVEYNLSFFRNGIDSVIFENPFRVTDEEGCLPTAGPPPTLTCGASNRFRMVRWQTDLAPNNDSHSITFWGKVDLTENTQLRGIVSFAQWTQNDAFLPWTLNTAIVPTHWDGQSPVVDPTDVNELPAKSANAKMRNITQDYALVNRKETFSFQARYRSQSLSNLTPTIEFPGYAAFGDSTWRAARTDFYNLPIENLDWDFRRQNGEAGFEWEIFQPLTWKFDYKWEGWNRKFRDVNRTNEHTIRTRVDFEYNLSGTSDVTTHAAQPVSLTTLRLKLDHKYSNRQAQAYNTQPLIFCLQGQPDCPSNTGGAPASSPQGAWVVTRFTVMNVGVPMEFNLLRRYDQMDRIRHDGSLTVELLRGPNTSLSASYRYLGDKHDDGFYGRQFNRFAFIDAQFSHIFESGAFLYASYSREANTFAYRDLAHLLPNPPAPPGTIVQGTIAQYPIANTWERTSRNSLDSFQFGMNVVPQEGKLQNWQFDLEYALSFARDRISTFNPYIPRADSILHAGANPYPDVVVRRQNVNIAVTRRITDRYEIGVRYWYEPYTQDDFSFDILAPYIHGNATSDLPKYMFQDARYGSYHGNVATVFLRYTF
jgi:hypothetical protein